MIYRLDISPYVATVDFSEHTQEYILACIFLPYVATLTDLTLQPSDRCEAKNEQSDVATYGGISKLYIIKIRIYLFFSFTDKVCGTKTELSNVAVGMYGGKLKLYKVCGT